MASLRDGREQFISWLRAIALGVAAGLALASKHTALFTAAAVFGACGLWVTFEALRRRLTPSPAPFPEFREGENKQPPRGQSPSPNSGRDSGWGCALQLIVAGVLALVVFDILNPAWWGDPVTRAGQVLQRRQQLLNEQVAYFGGYNGLGDTLAGFLRQTLFMQPQYFEAPGWENYIGDQIARYEASGSAGLLIGGSVVGGVILGGLVLVGFWALSRDRVIPTSTRWLIGIWVLAMIVTTALLTPLEWQRYYLPACPAITVLAALGVWRIMRTIRQMWLTKV
jgi:hypothetical protein